MTLTPLAPLQGPQPQAVPSLPGIPPPMQPTAGPAPMQSSAAAPPPYHADVVQNFQQAHGTLDMLSAGLATGAIPAPQVYFPSGGGGGGGGAQQQAIDAYQPDSYGVTYLKEGSPFSQYNQGVDQGPQTDSPAAASSSTPPLPGSASTAATFPGSTIYTDPNTGISWSVPGQSSPPSSSGWLPPGSSAAAGVPSDVYSGLPSGGPYGMPQPQDVQLPPGMTVASGDEGD